MENISQNQDPQRPPSVVFFDNASLISRVALSLPLSDKKKLQSVNHTIFEIVTPVVWKDIPSVLPLFRLFSALRRVPRRGFRFFGPILGSEVTKFSSYAAHVSRIRVLFDASWCWEGVEGVIEIIMGHHTAAGCVLLPKLESVGVLLAPFLGNPNPNLNHSLLRFSQLRSLTFSVNIEDVPMACAILRQCQETLLDLGLTGSHALDADIIKAVGLLLRLEAVYIDMYRHEMLTSLTIIHQWRSFVASLPRTVDALHVYGPPPFPGIVNALSGRKMRYVLVQTGVDELGIYLTAAEYLKDIPIVLRFCDTYQEENIRSAIDYSRINTCYHVFGNIAVIYHPEIDLKKPEINTRAGIQDILWGKGYQSLQAVQFAEGRVRRYQRRA